MEFGFVRAQFAFVPLDFFVFYVVGVLVAAQVFLETALIRALVTLIPR